MRHTHVAIIAALFGLTSLSLAQPSDPEITARDIRQYVSFLASDALEGRGSGTEGNRKAADYLVRELKYLDIQGGGADGGYLQPFTFSVSVRLGEGNAMTLGGKPLALGQEYRPLGFSANATATGDVVFAGYGITANDKEYDDYAGLDVKGKIVVVLRYAPDGDSPRSEYAKHTGLREKARIARDHGAAALVMITGPANDPEDELMKLSFDQVAANSGLPVISMKRSVLAAAFEAAGQDLKALQDSIKASRRPRSFSFAGLGATVTTNVQTMKAKSANVIGILPGNDPALKNEAVVIGAHYDHLGWGGPGSGSQRPDTIAIHNGADDNASGTAAVLELAAKFDSMRKQLRRTVVFAFFSGEELGTLGSQQYVTSPPIPLEQTVAMINLDMVGRLQEKKLTVGGTGTASLWPDLLGKYNKDSTFVYSFEPDGFGPSDHASFYGKNIPVLFFFTGTHNDYHKPSDDADLLNYDGEAQVARLAFQVARDVVQKDERPVYVRVESAAPRGAAGDARSFSVSLGIVPDFGQSSDGMKVSSVQPNRAGEKAGLKAGDVIVKMAGKPVLNIYDYMGLLGELKAGDVIDLEVRRDGQIVVLKATMERRK
jgi:hypothetical protein